MILRVRNDTIPTGFLPTRLVATAAWAWAVVLLLFASSLESPLITIVLNVDAFAIRTTTTTTTASAMFRFSGNTVGVGVGGNRNRNCNSCGGGRCSCYGCYLVGTTGTDTPQHHAKQHSALRSSHNRNDNDNDNDDSIASSASPNSAMRETSKLAHVQMKVSDVDAAVAEWTTRGGRVVRSRSNENTNELLSAFVELGYFGINSSSSSSKINNDRKLGFDIDFDGDDADADADDGNDADDAPFALELVKTTSKRSFHGLSYLGLSMLLKFQDRNSILELIQKNEQALANKDKNTTQDGDSGSDSNSNGANGGDEQSLFPIKYVASAPGDGFAQLALFSDNKLVETCDFYTNVLGMDQKAQDRNMLCLRYDNTNANGVTTTLIFENRQTEAKAETRCSVDHLVIRTTTGIEGLYRDILEENERKEEQKQQKIEIEIEIESESEIEDEPPVAVYMKPAAMFGVHVLGLIDPNGYKIVVCGPNP